MVSIQKFYSLVAVIGIALMITSCATVRPGEVGVKRKLGQLKPQVFQPGIYSLNPFTTTMMRVPTQTVNQEVKIQLPSKEGLNVNSEISILYHIEPQKAREVIENVGMDYENVLILSVFRSAAADICAGFYAKDMHSGNRALIEREIRTHMDSLLNDRGFIIEAVLLKSISLPQGLYMAIENKLEAEQEAQRMEFILNRERQEAERRKIEAQGIRDAQKILSSGLNDAIIKWRSLEVLEKLSTSPNAKLIITDGKAPVLIDGQE